MKTKKLKKILILFILIVTWTYIGFGQTCPPAGWTQLFKATNTVTGLSWFTAPSNTFVWFTNTSTFTPPPAGNDALEVLYKTTLASGCVNNQNWISYAVLSNKQYSFTYFRHPNATNGTFSWVMAWHN